MSNFDAFLDLLWSDFATRTNSHRADGAQRCAECARSRFVDAGAFDGLAHDVVHPFLLAWESHLSDRIDEIHREVEAEVERDRSWPDTPEMRQARARAIAEDLDREAWSALQRRRPVRSPEPNA